MESKSVKNNFIFQVLYNFVTMVVPLIVTPFLTRALLGKGLGEFTYTRSIASYFVIFSMLGIVKYGQRVIAQNMDDEFELRKSFWSLLWVHIFFSVISLLIYFLVIFLLPNKDKMLYWIQGIYVFSAIFDITWVYYGLENFKGVVIRNTVIKLVEAILYIILIKEPKDIYLYAAINSGTFLISQIVLWPNAVKEIKPIAVKKEECRAHIKPLVVFAIAVIGISLYTIFDTTLLGILSTKENVALYEYSNRIAKIPLTVASVIGTVLFPRACKLAAQNKIEEQKQYMSVSMIVVAFIGSVAFWGLASVGEPLALFYLGEEFKSCGHIIVTLAPLVYIIGIGDVVRTQVMIPNGMDRQYIISIALNAVINIIISTIFILVLPKEIQVYGAVMGTVSAESIGMIYQIILCRKFLYIKDIIKTVVCSFGIGAMMYLSIRIITRNIVWSIGNLILITGIGAIIFIPLTILYLYFCEKDVWTLLFKMK